MDPVDQDIKRHGIEESKYQKAFEALNEKVRLERTVFDSFLMNELPYYYESFSEDAINELHKILNRPYNNDPMAIAWNKYVDRETERRIL